jgi:hypothetical protein
MDDSGSPLHSSEEDEDFSGEASEPEGPADEDDENDGQQQKPRKVVPVFVEAA